jgi:hypothetical protein
MLAQDLEQAYLNATFDYLPKGAAPLAFLGGASSNLGLPTSSLQEEGRLGS